MTAERGRPGPRPVDFEGRRVAGPGPTLAFGGALGRVQGPAQKPGRLRGSRWTGPGPCLARPGCWRRARRAG